MKKQALNSKYEMFGRASLIPGMRYMIEQMQAELNRMTAMLQGFQETEESINPAETTTEEEAPRNPRSANYWAKLSPEQRKAEMKRRMGKDTAAAAAKRAKITKSYWAKMSPEERSAEMKRRVKVRRLVKQNGVKRTVKLAAAERAA